jgi:hypothetical protein
MGNSIVIGDGQLSETRCDKCRFWEDQRKTQFTGYTGIGVGECLRAKPLWERTKWGQHDETGKTYRVLLPEAIGDMFFVQDGSDYRAFLLTKPEFFCASFEPKE